MKVVIVLSGYLTQLSHVLILVIFLPLLRAICGSPVDRKAQ